MIFYRAATDGQRTDCSAQLKDLYGASDPSSCWIIGAGPSLRHVPVNTLREIERSPAGRIACNYGGRGKDGEGWLLKPNLWTTFDPTPSFSPLTFRDPSVTKFIKRGKEMDLVPGSLDKLCDCPATYFINTKRVSFTDFFPEDAVNDSRDTFIQSMAIAIALGFRRLYLLGTELIVRPSASQLAFAEGLGVPYPVDTMENRSSDLLDHFVEAVAKAMGVGKPEATKQLESLDREEQYAFSETKSLKDAVLTDWHYWERVQYLRLAKRNLSLRGVQVVSCTPGSRLNNIFPYEPPERVCERLAQELGSPVNEETVGKYTKRPVFQLPWHRDCKPYGWEDKKPPVPPIKEQVVRQQKAGAVQTLKDRLAGMAAVEVTG